MNVSRRSRRRGKLRKRSAEEIRAGLNEAAAGRAQPRVDAVARALRGGRVECADQLLRLAHESALRFEQVMEDEDTRVLTY